MLPRGPKQDDPTAAIDAYTRTIGHAPQTAMLYRNRAGEHLELEQIDRAEADLWHAAALEPDARRLEVNQRIQALEADDRDMVAPAVEQAAKAAAEIQQGDDTQEKQTFLRKRFTTIFAMAPDIGAVIVATLANLALGVTLTLQKIAQKAQTELGVGS